MTASVRSLRSLVAVFAAAIGIMALLGAFAQPVRADPGTLCVAPSGTGCDVGTCGGTCYASIQDAVDAAVPDDEILLAEAMIALCDETHVDVIVTTGGTGLTPRDRTPEATERVIDRLVPGIAEALRADGYRKTPRAVLSRGICGLRNRCLIINLPGSPKAVRDGLETLGPMLSHAIQMARGESLEHDVKTGS